MPDRYTKLQLRFTQHQGPVASGDSQLLQLFPQIKVEALEVRPDKSLRTGSETQLVPATEMKDVG